MNLRILLFAGLSDTCGSTFLEVELPCESTVAELKAAAVLAHPALHKATFRVAVNSVYVEEQEILPANAEVAFLPPVCGG